MLFIHLWSEIVAIYNLYMTHENRIMSYCINGVKLEIRTKAWKISLPIL